MSSFGPANSISSLRRRRRPCISLDYARVTKVVAPRRESRRRNAHGQHSFVPLVRAKLFQVALPTNSIRVAETSGSSQLIKKQKEERETRRRRWKEKTQNERKPRRELSCERARTMRRRWVLPFRGARILYIHTGEIWIFHKLPSHRVDTRELNFRSISEWFFPAGHSRRMRFSARWENIRCTSNEVEKDDV